MTVFQYTTNYKRGEDIPQKTQYTGNNLKSLRNSVEASLKKLKTDYIDILYVHWWDYTCGVEEVMNGLHNLVAQGKVLYLGVSDTPAWIVTKANTYARMSGKSPFVIYQGAWSILQRDLEREILPMALSEGKPCSAETPLLALINILVGLALAPWNVLAGGKIRTDAEEERRYQTGENGRTLHGPWKRSETERGVCLALEQVAKEIGARSITAGEVLRCYHE